MRKGTGGGRKERAGSAVTGKNFVKKTQAGLDGRRERGYNSQEKGGRTPAKNQ